MRALPTAARTGILLGLELLVASDIIQTITVAPTLESVGLLGAIVAIRTFLSTTVTVEVDGRWPWNREHRATPEAAARPARHGTAAAGALTGS